MSLVTSRIAWPSIASAARGILLLALVSLVPPDTVAAQELMPTSGSGWSGFWPRPESAPGLRVTEGTTGYSLEIFGNGVPNVYGGWRTAIQGLQGERYYRFRARALPLDVDSPRESVAILLRWRGAFGAQVAPDYVWRYHVQPDQTLLFDRTIQTPPGTTAVDVELVLQWAPNGRVTFEALSFMPSAAPAPRPVTAAAVHYRPSGTSSGLESVQRAAHYGAEVAAAHRPDLMVFGELLNVIGAPGSYDVKAEPVPGPSTDVMAGIARTYRVNVVFGMLERDGRHLYNSAVFIGRDGNVAGKYRKMQLPLAEVSAGITPGNVVPVFQTDVGRVALLICQDLAFPEPAREAALQGAELLLVPIWGGKAEATTARAIEHSVYVVTSGYDYLSEVLDPLGTVLDRVETLGTPGVAVANLDLSRRFREPWIGDWRDASNKQRRKSAYTAAQTTPEGEPGGGTPPPPDTEAPTASITSPAAGATVSGTTTVAVTASDNVAVDRVELLLDGMVIATDTSAPYSFAWDTTEATNGSHALQARAVDSSGNVGLSAPLSVSVSNSTGSASDVVLWAADASAVSGAWQLVEDASAAGGVRMYNPNAGAPKLNAAFASPADYFELTFSALAGTPYRLWIRGRADRDHWANDSTYVQFSGAVDASGNPVWRIGTTSATAVSLEECSGCGVSGWGWQDNGWGTGVLGPPVYFAASGTQTLRIQWREDGFSIDQIVLSPSTYFDAAPGANRNDTTVLPKAGGSGGTPPQDTEPPTVAITSPTNGETVSGTVIVTVGASDNVEVTRVELLLDGSLAATDTSAPYSFAWDTTGVANGTHTIEARAVDSSNNTGHSPVVSVNVHNTTAGTSEIVLWTADATVTAGGWRLVQDTSAAGGVRIHHPNAGAAKLTDPLSSPAHYFEATFAAEAGTPYRLWLRGRADGDFWGNDSVFIQFDRSVDSSGNPRWRIGTTSATAYNLEECSGCGLSSWGWEDNGWGSGVLGPLVYFSASGPQRIRVQTREDGLSIDQIVLSPAEYLSSPPGPSRNAANILGKTQ